MKTRSIKKTEIKNNWVLIDASGVRLGKLASKCASLLIGKNKINKVDYLNSGDSVIVVNAKNIDVYKKKLTTKMYIRHSGYRGGFSEKNLEQVIDENPGYAIKQAVWGMLPKNKMGREMLSNLHIYAEGTHEHEAQKPLKIEVK
jgi:large subunit ribosomal protein L13